MGAGSPALDHATPVPRVGVACSTVAVETLVVQESCTFAPARATPNAGFGTARAFGPAVKLAAMSSIRRGSRRHRFFDAKVFHHEEHSIDVRARNRALSGF